MGDGLAAFHDPHNGCLSLIVSICHHPFMRLFVLLFGFLRLDLIDLNAVFGVGEIEIHGKRIAVADIPATGCLRQYSIFCTGKRL